MKSFVLTALFISCSVLSASAAVINGRVQHTPDSIYDAKVVINDNLFGGVNVGAGIQGNNRGVRLIEAGAGKDGNSVRVNYDKLPGKTSYGPTGTVNILNTESSSIDGTLSHTKNDVNGFKFENNAASVNYANENGNRLGLSAIHTPGIKDTYIQSGSVNVLNSGSHSVDVGAQRTEIKYDNGPRIEHLGGKVSYENSNGHGAYVGGNHNLKNHQTNLNAGGNVNLFRTNDGSARIDLLGGAQQIRGSAGIQTEGSGGIQVQIRAPPPPPPPKPAPIIGGIDMDPRHSPFYYEGCNKCCWGTKKWSNQCALPDDYD